LNICSNDVKRLFKESFQFKEIYMIDCNDMELLTFFRGKQSMVSIHCLAAVYLLFIYVKQNSTAINFIQSLSHTIISARNAKKNIGTTVEIIKQLNIFQWGLIGNDQIKHYSIAPMMWEKLFTLLDYPVNYFVINESDSIQMKKKLSSLISDDAFIGANIAMPWKQLAFEHSDKIEEETKPSKVVNTLVLDQSLIKGYNTDGLGMIHALEQKDALTDKNVLLMGAGGAAQTLPYHLLNRNIQSLFICDIEHEKAIQLVNNNKFLYQKRSVTIEAISHNNITEISKDIDIIINATPCGMLNYHSDMPFCKTLFEDFKPMIVIGEMVYNPYETMLIKEAKKRNFIVSEGVNMLVEQAALSFYYGFGVVLNDGHKREMKETAIRYLI
jgi:shikimate dehydrogenase